MGLWVALSDAEGNLRDPAGRAHPRIHALHSLEDAKPPAEVRISMRGSEGMSDGPRGGACRRAAALAARRGGRGAGRGGIGVCQGREGVQDVVEVARHHIVPEGEEEEGKSRSCIAGRDCAAVPTVQPRGRKPSSSPPPPKKVPTRPASPPHFPRAADMIPRHEARHTRGGTTHFPCPQPLRSPQHVKRVRAR